MAATSTGFKVLRYLLIALLFLIVIFGNGISIAIYSDTLINPWIVPVVATAVAGASAWPFRRKWRFITGMGDIVNSLVHTAVVATLLTFGFYFTNYHFADFKASVHEEAIISARFTETRYKSRRVRRNVYSHGEPYKVYFIELTLPDGRTKNHSVTQSRYRNVRKGQVYHIDVAKGLWGVPVIKLQEPVTTQNRASRLKSSTRYQTDSDTNNLK